VLTIFYTHTFSKDYFAKGLDAGWDRRKLARVMTERAKGQSIAASM